MTGTVLDVSKGREVAATVLATSLTATQRLVLYDSSGGDVTMHWLSFVAATVSDADFVQGGIALPASAACWAGRRRAEYFYGRLAARRALAELGLGHHQVGTGTQREPCWPSGAIGSISHHPSIAAAVALPTSRYLAVGIDLERIVDDQTAHDLCSRVLSPSEQALLSRQAGEYALNTWLTVAFSAKESFFKAAFPFVLHYFDFDAIELARVDANEQALHFTVRETLCEHFARGTRCTIRYGMLNSETVCTSYIQPAA